MGKLPYSQLSRGTFLIASPELDQGLLFRSVILLCEHSSGGSFGLIINKPFELDVPDEIINPKEIINPNVAFRAGGPLQQGQMMLLHSSDEIPDQTLQICPNVYLGGDLNFLQKAMSNPDGPNVRLCLGFTGWSVGQLEKEFLHGDWFLHPASAQHIFETHPDNLWRTLLREMGGKYASMSMIPNDLSLN